jgi:methanogenic corrinoid protein MtbC1
MSHRHSIGRRHDVADNNDQNAANEYAANDPYEPQDQLDNVVPFDPTLSTNLMDTIETEILPRLMMLHSNSKSRRGDGPTSTESIDPSMVEEFVSLMLDDSVGAGHDYLDDFLDRGVGLEAIYLELLAPAARRMGELWESDVRDFADVTVGLCRLHEILRHNALDPNYKQATFRADAPSILLSTACGDQHVFGILMVAEFFRKAQWQVTCEPGSDTPDLVRTVAKDSFDMLGLSLSRTVAVADAADAIRRIRAASINKNLKVIIGGEPVARDGTIVAQTGADGATYDAANAPNTAMRLLADA